MYTCQRAVDFGGLEVRNVLEDKLGNRWIQKNAVLLYTAEDLVASYMKFFR